MQIEGGPAGANASDADSDETDFDGLKTLCEHGQWRARSHMDVLSLGRGRPRNAVPVEPCILRHQWSTETLNGPISIFHLPSHDNKKCRVRHNKHSEYPTSSPVTSPNRDIRPDEAPKPNGSRFTRFLLLHRFYPQNDFTHAELWTSLAWVSRAKDV